MDDNVYSNQCRLASTPGPSHSKNNELMSSPALSQISSYTQSSSIKPNNMKRISSTPFSHAKPGPSSAMDELNNFELNDITRKRRLNDLFGDIRDIDELSDISEYRNPKRVKTQEERDLEMIELILEARRKNQKVSNTVKKNDVEKLKALRHFKMQNLSYTVPKWPFITLTRSDEERVYVRFHSEEFIENQLNEIKLKEIDHNSLLGASKDQIWNGAREIVSLSNSFFFPLNFN